MSMCLAMPGWRCALRVASSARSPSSRPCLLCISIAFSDRATMSRGATRLFRTLSRASNGSRRCRNSGVRWITVPSPASRFSGLAAVRVMPRTFSIRWISGLVDSSSSSHRETRVSR